MFTIPQMAHRQFVDGSQYANLKIPDELAEVLRRPFPVPVAVTILNEMINYRYIPHLSEFEFLAAETLLTTGKIPERALVDFYNNLPNICAALLKYFCEIGRSKRTPVKTSSYANTETGSN